MSKFLRFSSCSACSSRCIVSARRNRVILQFGQSRVSRWEGDDSDGGDDADEFESLKVDDDDVDVNDVNDVNDDDVNDDDKGLKCSVIRNKTKSRMCSLSSWATRCTKPMAVSLSSKM